MDRSRLTRIGFLILATLLISFLVHTGDRDQADATSFGLVNPGGFDDLTVSAKADLKTSFTDPAPDANFAGVTTFLSPEFTINTSVPIGHTVGELRTVSTLGIFLGNLTFGPCSGAGTKVNFRLDAGAVNPITDGIVDPLPAGASARMQPMFDDDGDFNNNGNVNDTTAPYFESGTGVPGDATNANGIPDGLDRVPAFYNILFDFDVDGVVDANEIPITRATGFTLVSSETVMLSLVTFGPGQLLDATTSPAVTFVSELGYASVIVLTPPDPTVRVSPSPITDFCSPIRTSTLTCGESDTSLFDEQEPYSFGCNPIRIDHRYDRTNGEDGGTAGTCSDGIDNGDGDKRDFLDRDCYDAGFPFEVFDAKNNEDGVATCADGVDNDESTVPDTFIDIDDPDCHTDNDPDNAASYDPARAENGITGTCADGIDQGGGGTDHADSTCYDDFPGTDHKYLHAFAEDLQSGATCSDGTDNMTDGKIDFEDRDCYEAVKSISDGTATQGPAVFYDPFNSEDGAGANTCSDGIDNGDGDEDADSIDNIDQDDKDCWDGAGNTSVTVRENPSAPGQYFLRTFAVSGRDFDNDGLDAGLDACPQNADNDGDTIVEDLSDNDRDGLPDGPDSTPWDPRTTSLIINTGDTDADGIPDGCDPTPSTNTGFVGDHDGDGFLNTQDNCESVPNPNNTGGSLTASVDITKVALDIPLGSQAPDRGPLSDGVGAACDDSDNDGSEDGAGAGTCNDGIDNGDGDEDGDGFDEIDGNDLDCSANEGTASMAVDGTCDDGIDNDGMNGVDSADPLCKGPQTGGGADDTGVDLVDTDDDQDGIPDTADITPGIPSGHFHKILQVSPVCIGLTDTDGDGWCNATETSLGSDPNDNPAEQGTDCDNAVDDDGDSEVNDGCPVIGLIAEAGAQCKNATSDDTPIEDFDEATLLLPSTEGINDGCPAVGPGTPESSVFDFLLDPVIQTCDDGVDNDGDGDMDDADSGCLAEADRDTDGDSDAQSDPQGLFARDRVEAFLGTSHKSDCPADTTPNNEQTDATIADFDDDQDVDGTDVILFAERFGTESTAAPPVGVLRYRNRFDIFPDFANAANSKDKIENTDVIVLSIYFTGTGNPTPGCP